MPQRSLLWKLLKLKKKLNVEPSKAQEEFAVNPPNPSKKIATVSSSARKKSTAPLPKLWVSLRMSKNVAAPQKFKGKSIEKSAAPLPLQPKGK